MSLHDYLGIKFWFAIIGFTAFAFTIGGMIVD
jgi:hypothetical protein